MAIFQALRTSERVGHKDLKDGENSDSVFCAAPGVDLDPPEGRC